MRALLFALIFSSSAIAETSNEPPKPLPLDELRAFTQVFEQIRSGYVEDVSDEELFRAAIRGMLSNLDPHSTYLEAQDYSELQQNTKGNYGGIGIEISDTGDYIRVVSPIDDTPAAKAGILAGDRILSIDGTPTLKMTTNEAAKLMRGEPDSEVTLLVSSRLQARKTLTLKRALVPMKSVRQRMLTDDIGYLRVSQFQQHTANQARDAIDALINDNANAIILDLRNNPGGLVKSAIDLADLFIGNQVVVSTKGRHPSTNISYSATADIMVESLPVVILINEGSASASEIVAGALQDHHRALIIGTRSFGKGSVQSVLPISDTRAIKLTTARYYTPSGRSIQASGIEPDIYVERAKIEAIQPRDLYTTEADLSGHIASSDSDATEATKANRVSSKVETTDILKSDNQLFEALTAAKALSHGVAKRS